MAHTDILYYTTQYCADISSPFFFSPRKRILNPSHSSLNAFSSLTQGMTIHARITQIQPERFSVTLTSRTSDLQDRENKWKPRLDEAWDAAALKEDVERMEARKRKEEHRQTYTKRIIAHPQFKNIGYVIRLSA